MIRILVDIDERTLEQAAAKLGTKTTQETITKALEFAGRDVCAGGLTTADWSAWADAVAERLAEVDWNRAWTGRGSA